MDLPSLVSTFSTDSVPDDPARISPNLGKKCGTTLNRVYCLNRFGVVLQLEMMLVVRKSKHFPAKALKNG